MKGIDIKFKKWNLKHRHISLFLFLIYASQKSLRRNRICFFSGTKCPDWSKEGVQIFYSEEHSLVKGWQGEMKLCSV